MNLEPPSPTTATGRTPRPVQLPRPIAPSNHVPPLSPGRTRDPQTERYNCGLSLPGVFISFEGIDGSGKTTQLRLLHEHLTAQGRPVTVAREPGGTRVGMEIRRLLLDAANSDLQPVPELLLYFASRAQNIGEVILPALEQGRIVLIDRFTDATLAYQGYGRELGAGAVRAIEQVACRGLKPDLTLLLDIDVAIGLDRALARNQDQTSDESRMEYQGAGFFERVHQGYLALRDAEPGRIKRIDARAGIEQVSNAVRREVEHLLKQRMF